MSTLAMVTLRDGSQVQQTTLDSVIKNLEEIAESNAVITLDDLVGKCKSAEYKFLVKLPHCDSETILKRRNLIDQKNGVDESVKKIVLNSIVGSGYSIKIVDPTKREISQMSSVAITEGFRRPEPPKRSTRQ